MSQIKKMKKVLNAYAKGKALEAKDKSRDDGWVPVCNTNFIFTHGMIYRLKDSGKILFGFEV